MMITLFIISQNRLIISVFKWRSLMTSLLFQKKGKNSKTFQNNHNHNSRLNSTNILVEIADISPRNQPPSGAWDLRIRFVSDEWEKQGHHCIYLNINPRCKLNLSSALNISNAIDYIHKVIYVASKGYILHTHMNGKSIKGILLALCAQCISFVFGQRCVLTFHAGVHQSYFPKTGKSWIDCLMMLSFKTPRRIICNNTDVKKHIVKDYNITESKIHPIPAFCPAYMETEIGILPKRVADFTMQHNPLVVSYVHTFLPEFKVDLILNAIYQLREKFINLGLIIVGSKQFSEPYIRLIEKLKITGHILLTGNLPRPAFLAVLSQSSLYLRTPLGDGVASSVLESLSLGTPVVASDNGTRPVGCILYKDNTLEDMIDKVRYTINNSTNVKKKIIRPSGFDTIQKELDVLLSV